MTTVRSTDLRNSKGIVTAAAAAAVLCGGLAEAHHSYSAFDMQKTMTYTGTVVEFKLMNPHSHFILKVAPGAAHPATVGTWDVEGGSINIMVRQGWRKDTLKAGDKVTVVGHPMRDGAKGLALFYLQNPDGSRLYMDIARPKDAQ
jgi:hypothetical protein